MHNKSYLISELQIRYFFLFVALCLGCSIMVYVNSWVYWTTIIICNVIMFIAIIVSGKIMHLHVPQVTAIAFLAWIVFSGIYSKYKINNFNSYMVMAYVVITFVMLYWHLDCESKIVIMIKTLIIGEFAQAVYLIYYTGLKTMFSHRIGNDVLNANTAGIGFGTAALATIMMMNLTRNRLYACLAAFFILMLFLSGSRTALFSVAIAFLIFYRLKRNDKSKTRIRNTVIIVFILIVGSLLIFNVDFLNEIVGKRVTRLLKMAIHRRVDRKDASVYTRYQLYKYGLKGIIKKPIIGYGWDQYRYHVRESGTIQGSYHGKYVYSHSNVIELLFDTGIVGFSLFYAPIVMSYNKVQELKKDNRFDLWRAFAIAMIAKLVIEGFFAVYINSIFAWISIVICCAIANMSDYSSPKYDRV